MLAESHRRVGAGMDRVMDQVIARGPGPREQARAFKATWKQLPRKVRRRITSRALRGEAGSNGWEAQWILAYCVTHLNSRRHKLYFAIPIVVTVYAVVAFALDSLFGGETSLLSILLFLIVDLLLHWFQLSTMREAIEVNAPLVADEITPEHPVGYGLPTPPVPIGSATSPGAIPDTSAPSSPG